MPPARWVWSLLLVLGIYGVGFLHGVGLTSLVLLPSVAVVADLGLQRVRFDRLRVPDAAAATGLFVALLLPPTVPLLIGGSLAVLAVATKHILRYRGRPWLNPAALAVLVGAGVFAISPAWWVAVGPDALYLAPALGAILLAVRASRWRLPAAFLATYGTFSVLQHLVSGATTDPHVLLLGALDPTTVFFALFMVPEPRTSPANPPAQVLFASVVGISAAFAPIAFPTVAPLLALLAGNLFAIVLRAYEARHSAAEARPHPDPARSRRARSSRPGALRWTVGRRAAVGLAVLVMLVAVGSAAPAEQAHLLPPGSTGKGGTTVTPGCTRDNPSIPASTLSQLHQMLGPSVIRSYNSSTGVVVFYDPANQVTVTETDLFEDYGYAEFNGDDFAVSGCSG
jgi:NQR2, RnfD, RnfE family